MAVTSQQTALVVQAIGAPLFFCGMSLVYFTRFGYTTPLQTAAAFTATWLTGLLVTGRGSPARHRRAA